MPNSFLWGYVDTSHTCNVCDASNHRIALERGNEMLYLRMMFDEKLAFKEHMYANINQAYKLNVTLNT